jgi:hypothetical protein
VDPNSNVVRGFLPKPCDSVRDGALWQYRNFDVDGFSEFRDLIIQVALVELER